MQVSDACIMGGFAWLPGCEVDYIAFGTFCGCFIQDMDKPLGAEDFAEIERELRQCIEDDRRCSRVNDVKCDAIHTAKTYEEFADRVAAAHIRPLDKADFKKKQSLSWNRFAAKEKTGNE